ncbi:MAG TPA: hypothetical protein VKV03_17360 [Candidatus Binataceae bacterium]|nr:hypothetical protein [Candidatus Binataceae bacterium]
MAPPKLFEEFASWPGSAVGDVVGALPESLIDIGARGNVEQSLIRFRVLHYRLGFTIDGENHGPFALFKLLEKFAGLASEGGQRMNVFRNVQHQIFSRKRPAPN